ncbi:MAG: DUF2220 family protein, partial [Methylotetracoccus sp.]|nr:DUF2220 family protein [Methylotetracoccus sp.]
SARIRAEPIFPWVLRLRVPDSKALAERFDEVRQWIRSLTEGSKAERGFGYEIEWAEINHRQLGRNRVPVRVSVAEEADALRLIEKSRDAARFQQVADQILAHFPMLREWMAQRPMTMLEHAADGPRLQAVLAWFCEHPRPGIYLRQLDIAGVDTKFIETRKGLLAELLDRVLPEAFIEREATGSRGFEQRYGLRSKPPLVRFRLLDPRLAIHGLTDLSVPVEQFVRLNPPVTRVFITENEINGLAFPAVPESLVIFGLGYSLDRLAEVRWLADKALYYWGDIDTHGFAMLDRIRSYFPDTRSFLMDRPTLLAHRPLWVTEETPHHGSLMRLSDTEHALFEDLRDHRWGDRLRLEQERIAFGWLERALCDL